ncbi:tyrosine-type recombinase/integrase [Streptomyces sp. NPDC005098]|uniref:tyrosine-type recombinase/integrase n=1 Tax=Streptomyces sp. NPDC005098 TaxID=3154560 RepID=UPI0033B66A17
MTGSDTVQVLRRHCLQWSGVHVRERRTVPRRRRRFIQLYEEIGLPPVRLHDLRHGAATPAHAAGTDLKDIQEMLGHSSITITADTYTSLLPEADLAPKAWRPVRSRTAHASGPGRGVRGRIERLPGRETPGRWLNALCPRQDSNLRHPLQEFDRAASAEPLFLVQLRPMGPLKADCVCRR